MDRVESASALFSNGFMCSQAVLSVFAEELGLPVEMALRVAGAFGAGMARCGETCGAVSGALMAIGLKYAAVQPGDAAAKERCYAAARGVLVRFAEENGSTRCRDLLGIDVSTPEGLQKAREQALFRTVCPALVRSAVRIAEQILS